MSDPAGCGAKLYAVGSVWECEEYEGHEEPRLAPPTIEGSGVIDINAPRAEWVMRPGTPHAVRVEWKTKAPTPPKPPRSPRIGALHRQLVREAAERVGYTVQEHGPLRWQLIDRGRVVWSIAWLESGYFHGAYNDRSNYVPDYRSHAGTSTPRQILDLWLTQEFPEPKP